MIYLGASHLTDANACLVASTSQEKPQEADDRIMYHLGHAVKVDKYKIIVVSSPDTVMWCAIYNFTTLVHVGLHELWFVTGKILPLHEALQGVPKKRYAYFQIKFSKS